MATKNAQQRNFQALGFTYGMDTLEIRTSGGASVLATFTGVAFGIAASGAVALPGTITDASADATGTAAEARMIHTNGTASGYLVNTASAAIGDLTVIVDTGTGTLTVGDVVTFAGDTQEYIITKAYAGGAGTINIFPGLVAAPADDAVITLGTAREVSGLTVGTSGSDINLVSTAITATQSVSITSGTVTEPAATA